MPVLERGRLTLEQRSTLPATVKIISGLIIGDQLNFSLNGVESILKRNPFWEKASERHKEFKDTILQFKQTLNDVFSTRESYIQVAAQMEIGFREVKNQNVQYLLGEILFARHIEYEGQLDHASVQDAPIDTEKMLQEMGYEGTSDKKVKDITLNQVVEAVLDGRLRFTYQAKEN